MPIAFDPDAIRRYVLRGDRGKPEAPRFLFRFQTRRQRAAYEGLGRPGSDSAALSGPELMARLYERLAGVLVGWPSLVGEDGRLLQPPPPLIAGADLAARAEAIAKTLDEVLTDRELWELYFAGAVDVEEDDVKKSDSPSSGPPAGSAASADPDAAADANSLQP